MVVDISVLRVLQHAVRNASMGKDYKPPLRAYVVEDNGSDDDPHTTPDGQAVLDRLQGACGGTYVARWRPRPDTDAGPTPARTAAPAVANPALTHTIAVDPTSPPTGGRPGRRPCDDTDAQVRGGPESPSSTTEKRERRAHCVR